MKNIIKNIYYFAIGVLELFDTFFRVIYGYHFIKQPLIKKNSAAIILGNGPSLKNEIEAIKNISKNSKVDIWCVNFFANSDEYINIKPNNYVIADPAHWQDDVDDELKIQREQFLLRVNQVTSWNILFHLPFSAKGSFFCNSLLSDKIKIRFFNQTTVSCRNSKILFWLYEKELAIPYCQNVLIPALFLTILSGYHKVGIAGADHSWHRDIFVQDSIVMLRDIHFYDDEVSYKPFLKNKKETFGMAEIFNIWGRVFRQYEILSSFANKKNVLILNGSSVSYIDSFKRCDLSTF